MAKGKLIRVTTVPTSLKILLKGQHTFMSNHYEVVGVSSGGQDLEDVSVEEGIRVIPVEMTRVISPFRDMKSVWKLYKIFKKEKPRIVHTHTPKAGIVGMIAARLAGVKIRLHTVAGLPLMEVKGLKRVLLNTIEKMTYTFATGVYPNSNGLYHFIIEQKFCKKEKLKVIANGSSNGIDVSYFSSENISEFEKLNLKHELSIKTDDFVFIFVGRLVGDKGLNELMVAFKELSEKKAHVKLLLVGDSEKTLDPLLPDTLSEIENNPHIVAVGFQNDVRPYFAISDALVFPSYREGLPSVVMQAGSMGIPSIVTNITGCNEIIIDGKNGIIVPTKNSIELLAAMKQYRDNGQLKENASMYRGMIDDRYRQLIVWNDLLEEYKIQEERVP